jgi:(2Fe-2S) ferredoxin
LLKGHADVKLVGYSCFGQCECGPNVAFFPEATWYGGLRDPDAAERVARHAEGLQPLDQPPLELPDHERREHTRNIVELIATVERDATRPRHWWWPF